VKIKRINTLAITEYKTAPVYVLQFGDVFMRLFVLADQQGKPQIWLNHAFIKPRFINRMKYLFGYAETPYTPKELKGGKEALLSEAMLAIDFLTKPADPLKQAQGVKPAEEKKHEVLFCPHCKLPVEEGKPCEECRKGLGLKG